MPNVFIENILYACLSHKKVSLILCIGCSMKGEITSGLGWGGNQEGFMEGVAFELGFP